MYSFPPDLASDSVFARVNYGEIVEYPVTLDMIKNRRVPIHLFKQVTFETKPVLPPFHRFEESLSLVKETPYVSWKVVPLSIQEILDQLWGDKTELSLEEVDPILFGQVVALAREEVGRRLDDFAKSRGYDGIVSLCSYVDDPDPQQDAEGRRGRELRSISWTSIRGFSQKVLNKEVPIPRTFEEIMKFLPELTWE